MKLRKDFETYNQAVALYLKRELKKLNSLLKKNLLDHSERTLIRARLLNIEGKTKEALELLEKLSPTSLFLKAQKENVLSSLYDKLSLYQKAAVCNQKAINFYHQLNDQSGLFVSYSNLAVNYSRLSLRDLFEYNWLKAHDYIDNENNRYSLIRSKVSFLSTSGLFEEALKLLQTITRNKKDYSNKTVFLTLEANILFRLKRYDEALEIYEGLFKSVKSLTRHRIQYEYQITKSLFHNEKLKRPSKDFPSESEYYFLWQTLLHLQDGDPELAHQSWINLVKMNPDKYKMEFQYKDVGEAKSHFSQFYEYLKSNDANIYLNPFKEGSNTYKFVDILRSSETPLRKEILIERIWETQYHPDFDTRFYKLVQRVRKQKGISVTMRNSTYKIDQKASIYL